jgi:hypothetical protein
VVAAFLAATIWGGYWQGLRLELPFLDRLPGGNYSKLGLLALLVLLLGYVHFRVRRFAAKTVTRNLLAEIKDPDVKANYARAFQKNSCWYRSVLMRRPAGWGRWTQRRLAKVLEDTNSYIQKLNDMYTSPAGTESSQPQTALPVEEPTQVPDISGNPDAESLETPAPKDAAES